MAASWGRAAVGAAAQAARAMLRSQEGAAARGVQQRGFASGAWAVEGRGVAGGRANRRQGAQPLALPPVPARTRPAPHSPPPVQVATATARA